MFSMLYRFVGAGEEVLVGGRRVRDHHDVPYDYKGNRWVEVTTADGETVLVLSAATS